MQIVLHSDISRLKFKRQIEMCNLELCDDSIWENLSSHWTAWSELSDCDQSELKSRKRLCNSASGNCENPLDCKNCDESDYRIKEVEECKLKTMPG